MLNYEEFKEMLKKEGYSEKEIKKEFDELKKDEMENAIREEREELEKHAIECPQCEGMMLPLLDTNAPAEISPLIYGHVCEECGFID
jgi:hypothetical protein